MKLGVMPFNTEQNLSDPDWTVEMDSARVGPAVFDRFKGGRDGTLWYYAALSDAFSRMRPGSLAAELAEAVREMRALTVGAEDMAGS